jgi:hypothetical protein
MSRAAGESNPAAFSLSKCYNQRLALEISTLQSSDIHANPPVEAHRRVAPIGTIWQEQNYEDK